MKRCKEKIEKFSHGLCPDCVKKLYPEFIDDEEENQNMPLKTKADTVRYEDFGAIGDGKTDDIDAIIKAHKFANEHNLPVKADNSTTYYIGKSLDPTTAETSNTNQQ